MQGNTLLADGLKWVVGNGQRKNIWQDKWLPSNPPRAPKRQENVRTSLKLVKDLFIPGTTRWNEELIDKVIALEDRNLIKAIRPSLVGVSDSITWIYSKDGSYSVKSGYYAVRRRGIEQDATVNSQHTHFLFKYIWNVDVPPKLKHFWWRSLHNGLPVADNLKKRGLRVDAICQLCGEEDETVNHLLFQCKLTKEIWDLTPISTPSGEFLNAHNLADNLQDLIMINRNHANELKLLFLLGWRIWKMRNALIFENKRMVVPDVISQALVDLSVWNEACKLNQNKPCSQSHNVKLPTKEICTMEEAIHSSDAYCCFVDGSWLSPTQQAGIGWELYNKDAALLLRGFCCYLPYGLFS